jgi:osmotically inducible protein OsmC
MTIMKSTARSVWTGDVRSGSARLSVGSGAFPEQTIALATRTEKQDGHTNPEELIAAAHAACYSMALSAALTRNDTPPGTLEVTAECSLDKNAEGLKISRMDLSVSGELAGVDEMKFAEIARAAEKSCPVSNALRGNVEIHLDVKGLVPAGLR